ncbi:hypothetical protein LNN31_08325 [Acetobacterium wieringae]|uniref:ParA family protein n=1 Tax=Acetobacterium wieringae TaxID=52694 RepID=A0ABY6HLV8_9FIRM|nr:hypothetical protein [Acetobacterium wieringae]UYO64414.1 hypothetical protein LNN31_08325 [Acetobacterium wieringae]VUZ25210.1 Uncharacterised protein [Acetobacterium wieringae]
MELISVWGSPGGGKTTISIELAKQLSKQTQKNCLILFTDDLASPLNYLFPSLEDKGGSLGKIITTAGFYQEELIKSLVYHPDYKHLCFLGFRKNETRYNYPEISEMQVLDMFVSLGQLVDYVIVDCSTDFTTNAISQYALKEGKCIQVGGGDLKSISYFQDVHYLSRAYGGIRDKNVQVVNNPWDFEIWRTVADQYGEVKFFFPYCMEIQEHYLEERSLVAFTDRLSRDFSNEMTDLIEYLLDVGLSKPVEKKVAKSPFNREKRQKEKRSRKLFSKKTKSVEE